MAWLAALSSPWAPPIQIAGMLGFGWAEAGPSTGGRVELSQTYVNASIGAYGHYPGTRFVRYEALPIRPYPLGRANLELSLPVAGESWWNVGPAVAFDVAHTPSARLQACDRAPQCIYPGITGGLGGRARYQPPRGPVYAYETYVGIGVSYTVDGLVEPRPRARLSWVYDSGQTVALSFTGRGDAFVEVGLTRIAARD